MEKTTKNTKIAKSTSLDQFLLRKSYSQTSEGPSFPNASIGNPDETVLGPPIKTFGGDNFAKFSQLFFDSPQLAADIVQFFVFSALLCSLQRYPKRKTNMYCYA